MGLSRFWANLRNESYVLDPDNLPRLHAFFVLAVWNFSFMGMRRFLYFHGAGTLEIPVLFKVTIRRIAIVLRELVAVGLGEIPGLCLGEFAEEYWEGHFTHRRT